MPAPRCLGGCLAGNPRRNSPLGAVVFVRRGQWSCFETRGRGDTLFQGGPGGTGRSYSDFPTILASISQRLGKLPGDTVVYTGHGDTTTIAGELVHYDEWVARGH
jgi:hypothetical protein